MRTYRLAGWSLRLAQAGLAVFILSACGGGGGGGGAAGGPVPVRSVTSYLGPDIDAYAVFDETESSKLSPLFFITVDNAREPDSGNAGELDHEQRLISGGLLAGTLDADFTVITLDAGGTAELSNPANADFARILATTGADARFGVVGVPASLGDIPSSGTAEYLGSVVLDLNTDRGTFALTGDAGVSVDWAGGAETDFTNLGGRLNDIEEIANVGTVNVRGAVLSGTGFYGGTLTTTGDDLEFSTSATFEHAGQFYGPNAGEVGGILVVEDPEGANMSAVFIAN